MNNKVVWQKIKQAYKSGLTQNEEELVARCVLQFLNSMVSIKIFNEFASLMAMTNDELYEIAEANDKWLGERA